MNNPIASAIKQISDEKGIPQEQVVEGLEAALAAAYRKDFGKKNENIKVEFDLKQGTFNVFDIKTVVSDYTEEELQASEEEEEVSEALEEEGETDGKPRFNPKTDIMISEARKIKEDAELGDEIRTKLPPVDFDSFGRMAAQTAKQVLIQKDREAERALIYDQFKSKEDTIVIGIVQRREEHRVLVDFGKVTAIMPISEQIPRERYVPGERAKVYVVSVQSSIKGPEMIVSRAHPGMVKKIFEAEIPEIASGAIEIKGVSREAGSRSKVAVFSAQEAIDPIGSCIGQRGGRIQTIVAELGGEKVDLILYDEDTKQYIANALSPAKVTSIELDESAKLARVLVEEDQLSLAIGKLGQNVRLASQLTGWNIEVRGQKGQSTEEDTEGEQAKEVEATTEASDEQQVSGQEYASAEEISEATHEEQDES
ncbi:transcription termination/antitermination protein NusA [Candidatus Uhrbacteria bacterium]|nr:transcription termination/antitermination protein NusA [Candidatus Uhrbacteria bacterium]